MDFLNKKNELHKVAAYVHFLQLDRDYKLTGYEGYDKPALLGIASSKKIEFFGSRGAKSYIIESSADGSAWDTVVELDAPLEDAEGYPDIIRYKNANPDETRFYRIRSVMPDGTVLASEPRGVIGI